ncbi:putative tyrosyl-tRNA synthetase mitochondrial precursor [Tuber magnatum]|uniref:Tyrosine--tRNA ligase n=1 Tax=Tuber magnatum TaxID=42249 RepID=A0A317T2Q0_9PEZI|nr:putative tyrosyl-tRNA synthetase mitochondrial precursor [Tuber magnatum]
MESGPIVAYAGVDATAPSLHVGHLLPLVNLLHFYLHGHHVIALVGKSTASVGDPSGRVAERDSIASQRLEEWFGSLWAQIEKFFERGREYAILKGYNQANFGKMELKTNAEWLDRLGLVEFLATVGPHIRVSSMLARDSVKGRMNSGAGINFAEFTYQLLQSYDFWHLYRTANCRLQIGGSDQFGNITAGIDLISRYQPGSPSEASSTPAEAYGLTAPLLTTESGEKIGKSAGNAIWLDGDRTTPFELYQFFATLPDMHIQKYLQMFTLLPLSEISAVMGSHATNPESRAAPSLLAKEVVTLIHGVGKASEAEFITKLLFPVGEEASFSAANIISVIGEMIAKLARRVGAVKSRSVAQSVIKSGGMYVGLKNQKISDPGATVEERWLVDGEVLLLRVGKGKFTVVQAI